MAPQVYSVNSQGMMVSNGVVLTDAQFEAANAEVRQMQREVYLQRRRAASILAWVLFALGFIWPVFMWFSNIYLCPYSNDPEMRCQRLTLCIGSILYTLAFVGLIVALALSG